MKHLLAAAVMLSLTSFPPSSISDDAFGQIPSEQKAAWGQNVFIKDCLACHTAEPRNKWGPHLHRLVGRKAGSAAGFDYSDAFQKLNRDGITWTEANLRAFLRSPQRFAPGAQMWQVIPDEEIITVLIEYFKSIRTVAE